MKKCAHPFILGMIFKNRDGEAALVIGVTPYPYNHDTITLVTGGRITKFLAGSELAQKWEPDGASP